MDKEVRKWYLNLRRLEKKVKEKQALYDVVQNHISNLILGLSQMFILKSLDIIHLTEIKL